jgi:hypothetical protein
MGKGRTNIIILLIHKKCYLHFKKNGEFLNDTMIEQQFVGNKNARLQGIKIMLC